MKGSKLGLWAFRVFSGWLGSVLFVAGGLFAGAFWSGQARATEAEYKEIKVLPASAGESSAAPVTDQASNELSDGLSETKLAPLWEVGLAGGAFYLPDYPGSEQSRAQVLALPYFIYRGRYLRSDRDEGLRSRLLTGKKFKVDLGAGGSFRARSEDNDAREGMLDLSWLLEAGPRLNYIFIDSARHDFRFQLPYLFAVSTDFRTWVDRGTVTSPSLRYRRRGIFGNRAELSFRVGATWTSRRFAEYFYEVTPRFERLPDRPVYDAQGGFFRSFISAGIVGWWNKNTTIYTGISQSFFSGSANEDSPLLTDKQNISYIFGVALKLWESETREHPEFNERYSY